MRYGEWRPTNIGVLLRAAADKLAADKKATKK